MTWKQVLAGIAIASQISVLSLTSAIAEESRDSSKPSEEVKVFVEELGIDSDSAQFQEKFAEASRKLAQHRLTGMHDRIGRSGTLPFDSEPDGCSYSPDRWGKADFKPACDAHDRCYNKNSRTDRRDCDYEFGVQLLNVCRNAYDPGFKRNACNVVAGAYVAAVRQFGSRFYKGQGLNN